MTKIKTLIMMNNPMIKVKLMVKTGTKMIKMIKQFLQDQMSKLKLIIRQAWKEHWNSEDTLLISLLVM